MAAKKTATRTSSATAKTLPAAPPGLLDGNGRAARLARWLRDKPSRPTIDTLVLEVKSDGGWTRLQCWVRSDVDLYLAAIIDEAVSDHATEVGAYLTARVSWLDSASGEIWTEHALRAQPEGMSASQSFAGDATSVAIQTQLAAERLGNMYMGGIDSAVQLTRSSAEMAHANFEAAQADNVILREKISRLESDIADLERQLDEALAHAEAAEESTQKDTRGQQLTQLMTAIIASQQGGQKPQPS